MGILQALNPLFNSTAGSIRAPDFPGGFIMEELNLSGNIPAVTIALTGNMMPHVPFSWGGTQKVVKDYYPGNPEAKVQILGSRESDFTVKGRIHAKKRPLGFTGGKDNYQLPNTYVEEIDKLRIRGNIVKTTLGEWVRYCILQDTKWNMKNFADIEYELTFTVISITEPHLSPVIKGVNLLPAAVNNELLAAASDAAARQALERIPNSVPTSISGLIDECTSGIASAVTAVTDFVSGIITTGEDITNSINRAKGVVKTGQANVSRFKRRLANISYGLSFAGIKVPERYSTSHIISSRIGRANDYSHLLAQMQKQFKAIYGTLPLGRYKVIEGDSLQKIAVRYYKNADLWKKIYDHNKLTTTVLTSGAILEIPKL